MKKSDKIKQIVKNSAIALLCIGIALIFNSCRKKQDLPSVTTLPVTGITQTSGVSGGIVADDGGSEIILKGICWNTEENPTLSDFHSEEVAGSDIFTCILKGLGPDKAYYVRAFATNSAGTGYGDQKEFRTLVHPAGRDPEVILAEIGYITAETACCLAEVTDAGDYEVIRAGVCWGLAENPTSDLLTRNENCFGNPCGGAVTNLNPGTTYHVRAFAESYCGTSYSEDKTFTTLPLNAPSGIVTRPVTAVSSSAVISGGSVSQNGGSLSLKYGICWGTSPNPDTSSSKIIDPGPVSAYFNTPILLSEPYTYTSIISGLLPNTTYYLRAFASNKSGVTYGNQETFNTLPGIRDIEGREYSVSTIGTQTWMNEDLRTRKLNDATPIPSISASDQSVWDTLSSPGFCLGHVFPLEPHPEEECDVIYNWQCVNTGKLCPVGWHVPTDSDWEVLRNYISNNSVVTKFGTVQWIHCDIPVTDTLKYLLLSAWSGGYRDSAAGYYYPLFFGTFSAQKNENIINMTGFYAYTYWWSSTSSGAFNASSWILVSGMLHFETGDIKGAIYDTYHAEPAASFRNERRSKNAGFPVRCIKN